VSHDDGPDLATGNAHLSTATPTKPLPQPFTLPASSKWTRPTTGAATSTPGSPSGLALGKWARIPPKPAVLTQTPAPPSHTATALTASRTIVEKLPSVQSPPTKPPLSLETQHQSSGPLNQPVQPLSTSTNVKQSEGQLIHAIPDNISNTKEKVDREAQPQPQPQPQVNTSTSQTVQSTSQDARVPKSPPKLFDPTKRPLVLRKPPVSNTTASSATPAIPSLTPQAQSASNADSILLGKWARPVPKPEPFVQVSPPKDVRPASINISQREEPTLQAAPSVVSNPATKLFGALSKPVLDKWNLSDKTTSQPSVETPILQSSIKPPVQTLRPVQQPAIQLNPRPVMMVQQTSSQVEQQNTLTEKASQTQTSTPILVTPAFAQPTPVYQVPASVASISAAAIPVNQAPAPAIDAAAKMANIEKMLEDQRRKSYEEAGLIYPGPANAPAAVASQTVPASVTATQHIPTRPPLQPQTAQTTVSAPHIPVSAHTTPVAPSISPASVKLTMPILQNTPRLDIPAERATQTQPSMLSSSQTQFGTVEALLNRYSKKPPTPLPMGGGQIYAQGSSFGSTVQSTPDSTKPNHLLSSMLQRQADPHTINRAAQTPLPPLGNDKKLYGFDLPSAPSAPSSLQRPKLFEARMPDIPERKLDPQPLTTRPGNSFGSSISSANRSFKPNPPKPAPTLSISALDKWARPASLPTDAAAPAAVSFLDIASVIPETPPPPPEATWGPPRIRRSDGRNGPSAWATNDSTDQQVSWGQGGRVGQSSTAWSQGGPNARDRAQYAASNFGASSKSSEFNALESFPSNREASDTPQPAWQVRDRGDGFAIRGRDAEYDPNYLPSSAEAQYLEEEGRRKKKRFAQAVPEDNEWARKKSGKERDKLRHGREFVEGNFEAPEMEEGGETRAERKARRKREKEAAYFDVPDIVPIYLPEFISISRLAQQLKIHLDSFTRKLEEMGFTELNPDFGR